MDYNNQPLPLISLAMPVYNVEKYIERGIMSALSQTYPNLEIIVVDDRGNDNSVEIIRKIQLSHQRGSIIKIIHHGQNLGSGATRNTAIDVAKGEFLYFMDSDDYIEPNAIETLYRWSILYEVDIVIGSYIEKGNTEKEVINELTFLSGAKAILQHIINFNNFPVALWNKLFRLRFLRENNLRCVPNHLNEDLWLTFLISTLPARLVLVPDLTYLYFLNPNSTTDTRSFSTEKRRRIIDQYKDIDRDKKDYLLTITDNSIFDLLLLIIIRESFRHAFEICCITFFGTPGNTFMKIQKLIRNRDLKRDLDVLFQKKLNFRLSVPITQRLLSIAYSLSKLHYIRIFSVLTVHFVYKVIKSKANKI